MFELPEPEKMRRCESHRLLGNYLFNEGRHMAPKAAEQYKLVRLLRFLLQFVFFVDRYALIFGR